MSLVKVKPTSPGRRALVKVVNPALHKGAPVESLVPLPPAGIDSTGPSTKLRGNSATRTCRARSRVSSAVRSVAAS